LYYDVFVKSLKHSIFHIDANSAYLSWTAVEMLRGGAAEDIRLVPSAIGGDQEARHGIILAKSIPAKKYGIKTAMTLGEARRLCPQLVILPPDHRMFMRYSNAMYGILAGYSNVIERYSIDECFVDYTGSEALFGEPLDAAFAIKNRIRDELGFTVNVGVSSNKFLAKMASEFEKPDKLHTLFPDEIEQKMWPLPVGEMFSVGSRTKKKLLPVGINSIGDLARADLRVLTSLLGPAQAGMLHGYANGIDDSPVVPNNSVVQKSIGNSTTLPRDVTTAAAAHKVLLSISERVAERLREFGGRAGLVSVTIRNNELEFYRRQRKLPDPIFGTTDIYRQAVSIFDEMWQGDDVRLLGINLGDLSRQRSEQISLFGEQEKGKNAAIDDAIGKVRGKFGEKAIIRGTFADNDDDSILGRVNDGNYLMMQ
jgi:DNA polymerase-4